MTGYTPASTTCEYCGGAVFPNTANALSVKRGGEWADIHYQCPDYEL